jgi:Tfp pilus assembly protein PilX
MTSSFAINGRRRGSLPGPARQQGVVVFVALIAMLVLTLAGLSLVRAVDTGGSVAANVAFRTASIVAANHAIEEAVYNLFKSPTPIAPNTDDAAKHYYSSLQINELSDGTPEALAGTYPPPKYTMTVYTDATTNVEVRYLIERVCTPDAAGKNPTIGTCDLLPPKVSPAGTDNEIKRIPLPAIPHYRVTARVDVPNTNATAIAQTFLR